MFMDLPISIFTMCRDALLIALCSSWPQTLQSMAKNILILSLSCNARQSNDVKKSNKHSPLKKVVIWNRYSMAIVKSILLFSQD